MPQSGFQALILCGPGIGLSTFTSVPNEYPKALISIANRPMVWYVLDWCYRTGVTDITLITPPASKSALAAALAQNPYLTSLPSPSPDLLAPPDLDHTTPTAELLRLPEIQSVITTDFILLPCDLICDVPGETFLESYLTNLGGLGGVGTASGSSLDLIRQSMNSLGGERSGRRGGLSVWYNTAHREESVKHEECDYMCTSKLDQEHDAPLRRLNPAGQQNRGTIRKLVFSTPMSELSETVEARNSMVQNVGPTTHLQTYRDSHIYLFPYWVKEFARWNGTFESVSEDLVGTWAQCQWRKSGYRERHHARDIFGNKHFDELDQDAQDDGATEDELDLVSLSSTQTSRQECIDPRFSPKTIRLASSKPDGSVPPVPPILSYIHMSTRDAPLIRRVDTTPLLLSVSLLLAKLPSIEDTSTGKAASNTSPFAHPSKVATTTSIAQKVTISRSDTLIDSNTTVASQAVIKSCVIGSSVNIGTGARLTSCLVMDGASIGDKCVLTNTVIGKKAKIGNNCTLNNCEVQDGNLVANDTEGKGEKYLIGGLEDEMNGFDDDEIHSEGEGTDLKDENGAI